MSVLRFGLYLPIQRICSPFNWTCSWLVIAASSLTKATLMIFHSSHWSWHDAFPAGKHHLNAQLLVRSCTSSELRGHRYNDFMACGWERTYCSDQVLTCLWGWSERWSIRHRREPSCVLILPSEASSNRFRLEQSRHCRISTWTWNLM